MRCSDPKCGALILPGDELESTGDRRLRPRINPETILSVEYLLDDKRIVEQRLLFVDASIVGISTILDHYPSIGSHVILELSNAGEEGGPWRVRGVVREVRPAEAEGFRVGIEVLLPENEEPAPG